MRGPLVWLVVAAGVVAVLLVTVAIGNNDKSGETVSAGEWAQSVCGAVGTWRGEMEAIVESVRTPASRGTLGVEEPQSQTPQGRTGLVRDGLESAVQATDTLVEGIDNAGTPDTSQGAEAAQKVSDWADSSRDELDKAQDSLDEEAETLEQAITQFRGAAGAVGTTLASGVQTFAQVAQLDPLLVGAFEDSSTCQQLREEQSST
jgi:hypothetical protein